MNSSSRSVVMVQANQTTRAWRDSNPQPSDPKFCILTCSVVFCNVPLCIQEKAVNHASPKVLRSHNGERIAEQTGSGLNIKSGKQVANTITRGAGKNDSRYWRSRIFRPINARGETSPHYSMRLQMRGQRMAFSLGTGNAEAAARIAAKVYTDFLILGVQGALAKYRPQKATDNITTLGEWIEAARRLPR